MEWGQVQEGVASAEGEVELDGVWELAEEKDWASKLSQGRSLVVSLLPGNPPWQSDSVLS